MNSVGNVGNEMNVMVGFRGTGHTFHCSRVGRLSFRSVMNTQCLYMEMILGPKQPMLRHYDSLRWDWQVGIKKMFKFTSGNVGFANAEYDSNPLW